MLGALLSGAGQLLGTGTQNAGVARGQNLSEFYGPLMGAPVGGGFGDRQTLPPMLQQMLLQRAMGQAPSVAGLQGEGAMGQLGQQTYAKGNVGYGQTGGGAMAGALGQLQQGGQQIMGGTAGASLQEQEANKQMLMQSILMQQKMNDRDAAAYESILQQAFANEGTPLKTNSPSNMASDFWKGLTK